MTTASIKSGSGVTRLLPVIVAAAGSASALDNNAIPRSGSTVGNGTINNSGTNGSGLDYREASGKFFTNTVGAVFGTRWALPAPTNMVGALLFVHVSSSSANPFLSALTTATGMGIFANSSGVGTEEASWSCKGTGDLTDDYTIMFCDPSRSTNARQYDNGTGGRGTFDPSDVTDVGVWYQHTLAGPTIRCSSWGMLKPVIVIGGTTTPGNFDVIKTHIYNTVNKLHEEPELNLHRCKFSWQIGDGTTATRNTITGKTFVYPTRVSFSPAAQGGHFDDNAFGHRVVASSADIIVQSNCSHSGSTPFHFTVLGSAVASVTYTSVSVAGAGELQVGDGFTFTACSFISCVPMVCSQPTFVSCSFSSAPGAALVSTVNNSFANSSGLRFASNQTAIKIDVAGNCTIDVSSFTFTGNTYDIEYTGTGTLTVISSVTHAGKTNASGGGTITVIAPTTTQTITCNVGSALVRIWAAGTQTLLATGSGSASYTYSSPGTYDLTIDHVGYDRIHLTGLTLSNTTVPFSLSPDRVYQAGHGLAYGTDVTWNPTTKKVDPITRQDGRKLYSCLKEALQTESALFNKPFHLAPVGYKTMVFSEGAELEASHIDNWKGMGVWYISSAAATTAQWISLVSQGTMPAGVKPRWQFTAGGTVYAARVAGALDEIVQVYGDATHGNFDRRGAMVVKAQSNPYDEVRVNLLSLFGIAQLEATEYVISLAPTAIDVTAGASGATLAITNHSATPVTNGGLDFSIVIESDATGEQLLREVNYRLAQVAAWLTYEPFNLPQMIVKVGDAYETKRGVWEGSAGASLKGVLVLTTGGALHPGFVRYQSDSGAYLLTPLYPSIQVTVGAAAVADTLAWYQAYFKDGPAGADFDTASALTVLDSAGDPVEGIVSADALSGVLSFVFDYDGDTVGGTAGTDKTIVFRVEGDGGVKSKLTEITITRTAVITAECIPEVETNE